MTKKQVGSRIRRGEIKMQDCVSSNKIKENKYKILRMSLILGSDENREETINNFEEAAREIDAMNDEIYLKDLEDKFYDTLKLEEEEKKLAILVDYIGGRVEQRISLLSDFANITGYDLSNLPPIKYYDKLDDYKERLKYIREYLKNTEQIKILNQEIEESEKKLKEAYLKKATSEECNTRNEEILLNKFTHMIKDTASLKDITEENIDTKLTEISILVKESKKSLDIFTKSFTTLSGSGISYEEEQEYRSYVDNAKEIYYSNKEQEYLLKIYKYLLSKETEYSPILEKREMINDLLYERLTLRKKLNIEEIDFLEPLYDLLERQYNDIQIQKDNIENIEILSESISNKKEKLTELEQDNQKVEILSLLREFCMIDTYSEVEMSTSNTTSVIEQTNDLEEPIETNEEEKKPEKEEEASQKEPEIIQKTDPISSQETAGMQENIPKDNQVVSIDNANNIDLDLIHSKANKVMKRVGEMLGIKTEETKIVSVSNPIPVEEKVVPKKEPQPEKEIKHNPLPLENPLFNNNLSSNNLSEEPEDSFWFPSDTPDALNELPDLAVSNNTFFANNNIPDLNFPDLKLDFGNGDLEETK